MNKIKIGLLVMLVLIVSGCKFRSNITIHPNGTVSENVTITENKDKSLKINYSEYIDEELNLRKPLIDYGNYEYKKINNDKSYGAEVYKKYDSVCSYFKDTLFNQYFYKHINCEENDSFIIVKNDTPFLTKNNNEDYSNLVDLSDAQLSITMPFKAYENNADEISGNTYIWKFDYNQEEKNIYLMISKNDLIEANKKAQSEEKKGKVLNVTKVVLIIISVFAVIMVVSLQLYKKYKANKLEY